MTFREIDGDLVICGITHGAAFLYLRTVTGSVTITEPNFSDLASAFPILTTVGGYLYLEDNAPSQAWARRSRALPRSAAIWLLTKNSSLTSLGSAFTGVPTEVGGNITIADNGDEINSDGTITVCLSDGGTVLSWEVAPPNETPPTTC